MIAYKIEDKWALADSWNYKGETYHKRDKIKELGGVWDGSRRHWIVDESAVMALAAERVNDPFYPNLHKLNQMICRLGMDNGLVLELTYTVEFEYKTYENWGIKVVLQLFEFGPEKDLCENVRRIVGTCDSTKQFHFDNSLPAFKTEGAINELDKLCEKAVDFVINWREKSVNE